MCVCAQRIKYVYIPNYVESHCCESNSTKLSLIPGETSMETAGIRKT